MALPNLVAARRAALVEVERHLPAPGQLIEARRGALALMAQRLGAGLRHWRRRASPPPGGSPTGSPRRRSGALREARSRLEGVAGRLQAVSPEAVLARGYVLVFDRKGTPLTRAAAVGPGADLRLHFADGDLRAVAAGRGRERQGTLPL